MNDHNSQNNAEGQSGLNSEIEQRNRENETGQSESLNENSPEGGQSHSGQADYGQAGQSQGNQDDQTGGQSGFVGSGGDQSSDYLTEGEQDFAPEGQGATDTDAGTSDIETGEPNKDSSNPSF